MTDERKYEIVETKYSPKTVTRLDFLGTFEQSKEKAIELAKQQIGVRYAVFPQNGIVAEYQAYYRTTIKCPKCGEVIPIE
ncbi:hypothetical protein ABFB09_07060 [Dehalogenimonas sp. THU2]|uniref:hypothetical protein n=1 Tax=Dehalogenimonas sp. THU2 TaxID=3151121 RepID=UPI0032189E9D